MARGDLDDGVEAWGRPVRVVSPDDGDTSVCSIRGVSCPSAPALPWCPACVSVLPATPTPMSATAFTLTSW